MFEKKKEEEESEPNPAKEKELAAAEMIIEGMIDIVGISDIGGRIIQINSAVESWGYKKEELIGKPVVEVIAKRSLPKLEEERKKIFETGVMKNLELIGFKKDGSEFPVLVNVSLMKDAEGKPTGRIFALRDITELKRAQDEIVTAKDYTDNIIKSMIDTLIVVDPDGKIRMINPATVELLGYKEEELIGKPVATIFAEAEEESSIFKGTRLKKLIGEGSIRNYDITCRTKTGENIPVSFSGSVMKDKQGKLVGIVSIAHDMRFTTQLINDLKKSESHLRELAATLEEKVKERTRELEESRRTLQEKVDELEKFSKLTIGRELKMVELKEKIKMLEQELEKIKG